MKAVQRFFLFVEEGIVHYSQTGYNKFTALFVSIQDQARALTADMQRKKVFCLLASLAVPLVGRALLIWSIVSPIFTSLVVVGVVAAEILLLEISREFRPFVIQDSSTPPPHHPASSS